MVIECGFCKSKVDGKEIGEVENWSGEDGPPYKVTLLSCPICGDGLLAYQEFYGEASGNKFDEPVRVWPYPDKNPDWRLPKSIKDSLTEATLCFKARAFNACAVMCGLTLENICAELKTKNKFLAGGLKELLEIGLIDKKIYSWGEELRKHRNMGAHASNDRISEENAKDLLEFASAICDYIFLLTMKFEEFMKRNSKKIEKGEVGI